MRDEDRQQIKALAFLTGIGDAEGILLPKDVLDRHDWENKLLRVRDIEGPQAPDGWVPWNLHSAYSDGTAGALSRAAGPLIRSPGAVDLWDLIEQSYRRPTDISAGLPCAIQQIREEWERLSKDSPAEHRDKYLRLKSHALALATELKRIEALDEVLTGDQFDFMRLYSEEEQASIFQAVRHYNLERRNVGAMEERGKDIGWKIGSFSSEVPGGPYDWPVTWQEYNTPEDSQQHEGILNQSPASIEQSSFMGLLTGNGIDWDGIVPSMPPLLRRLADYFDARANSPALQRPKYENAELNFFARGLCQYFWQSRGDVSPSIVARIVSMFYPQGIGENNVSKIIAKVKEDRPWQGEFEMRLVPSSPPDEPDNSPLQ